MAEGDPKVFTEEQVQARIAEETRGLKENKDKVLNELAEAKQKLKPWEGKDPERVAKVLEEHERLTADRQKAQGNWEEREATLRGDFKQQHDAVVGPLQVEVTTLKARLFDAVAVRDASEAIAAAEGNPKLLLPVIRDELITVEVEGRLVTAVKGLDGKPRYHATTNALVTPTERVAELRANADYAGAFKGAPGSGGGARESKSLGGKVYRTLGDFSTTKEKVDFIAEHGQAAFEAIAYATPPGPVAKAS